MRTRTVSKSKQRPKDNQRAEDIANAGGRVGIPISDDHAQLAAKWGDSLYLAFDVVRAIDYQDHEPPTCSIRQTQSMIPAKGLTDEQQTRRVGI